MVMSKKLSLYQQLVNYVLTMTYCKSLKFSETSRKINVFLHLSAMYPCLRFESQVWGSLLYLKVLISLDKIRFDAPQMLQNLPFSKSWDVVVFFRVSRQMWQTFLEKYPENFELLAHQLNVQQGSHRHLLKSKPLTRNRNCFHFYILL